MKYIITIVILGIVVLGIYMTKKRSNQGTNVHGGVTGVDREHNGDDIVQNPCDEEQEDTMNEK